MSRRNFTLTGWMKSSRNDNSSRMLGGGPGLLCGGEKARAGTKGSDSWGKAGDLSRNTNTQRKGEGEIDRAKDHKRAVPGRAGQHIKESLPKIPDDDWTGWEPHLASFNGLLTFRGSLFF